jgi:uncharacterized oligopeptide transporter (OPT) family protein
VVILVLYETYGFGPGGLEAPQASAMAAILEPLMSNQPAPWLAYMAGIFLAVILELVGVPPLAFALGMYLPIHLNTPLLIGGLVAHFVAKSTKNEDLSSKRKEKGTLIASGFIAGGAIMGVISAFIVFTGKQFITEDWNIMQAIGTEHWVESAPSEILGFVMLALLCVYMYWNATRVKE